MFLLQLHLLSTARRTGCKARWATRHVDTWRTNCWTIAYNWHTTRGAARGTTRGAARRAARWAARWATRWAARTAVWWFLTHFDLVVWHGFSNSRKKHLKFWKGQPEGFVLFMKDIYWLKTNFDVSKAKLINQGYYMFPCIYLLLFFPVKFCLTVSTNYAWQCRFGLTEC